jgi:predicted RNase H-like HicB family nuclease
MKLCVKIRPDERRGFVAVCPSLPGCTSCGQTHQQARKNLRLAIRGYLASVNDFVPEQIQEEVEEAWQV